MEPKNVIHYYVGCDIINISAGGEWLGCNTEVLTPQCLSDIAIYEFKDFKPILRRLTDITHDEYMSLKSLHIDRNPAIGGLFKDMKWTPEEFHWLLQHGFDLFNLIDSNQALDKATLK